MSDMIELDETSGVDMPLMAVGDEFTELVKESIVKDVNNGHTPESAAIRAGLSIRTFRTWLRKYDVFADWVEGLKLLQSGGYRAKTIALLERIESDNPAKAAELYMRFLNNIDEEFTSSRAKAENRVEFHVELPAGSEERQAKIIRESEKRVEITEVSSV